MVDEKPVEISIPIGEDVMRISVVFRPGDSDNRQVEWRGQGDKLIIEFSGWRNPLGTATDDFVEVGDADGRKIYFQAVHYLIGKNVNSAALHIYLEAAHG